MFGDPDELRKYFRSVKRRRSARLETQGLCNRCGDRPPKEGLKNCAECIADEVAGNRLRRDRVAEAAPDDSR